MAKNNNIRDSLIADVDDEPTAELEVLSDTYVAEASALILPESNELTHTFGNSDEVDEIPVARLRSHLRTRNESINKLQYDIEQLRARWTGLEKEIKAREQLTDRLHDEIRDLHSQLATQEGQHNENDKLVTGLRDQLASKNTELAASAAELTTATENTTANEARIAVLEMQQTSDAAKITALEKDLQHTGEARERQTRESAAQIEVLQTQLHNTHASLDDLKKYVEERKAEWQEQRTLLADRDKQLAEQAAEFATLRARLDAAETSAARSAEEAVAELCVSVQDAHQNATVLDLRAQIERTEGYADTVRRQLQLATQDNERREDNLDKALETRDHALAQMQKFQDRFEEERQKAADTVARQDDLRSRHDSEIEEMQATLEDLQQTLDEQRAINEELAEELLTSNESGQKWQERLNAAEERSAENKAATKDSMERQQQQIEELRHKIESKDNAIASLLNELAKKSSAMNSLDEIGHAVSELDDRMLASIDDRDPVERERSTRLLIGMIDGQKLRFPLFKDRLSIGRSADNDIQLKTPCISRKHAIIESNVSGCRIVDQDSKNGVFLNGHRVGEAQLVSGDKLVIGTAKLVFEERSKR